MSLTLLVLCTANQCRSPMAGALLERALQRAQVAAIVVSAGFGRDGVSAPAGTLHAAARHGLSLEHHRSRRLTVTDLRTADVVLVMERGHVHQAVVTDVTCWPKCFTLKEVVRRAHGIGRRETDEGFADWLGRLHEGRRPADLLTGRREDDEVRDPVGAPDRVFQEVADELTALVDNFVDLAFPRSLHRRTAQPSPARERHQ